MTLAAIVAHDPHLVIGLNGEMPWHYSNDLKHFKRTTMGHPIIMGRIVFESINEKPLPGRENIVLSRTRDYEQATCFDAIPKALDYVEEEEQAFIIGGAQIYKQLLPEVEKLFVTEIHQTFNGDTYFPEYRNQIGEVWKETKREEHPKLSFVVYERMANR